jgi:PQQ-dependent catabolism-associated beta-propeller protein
MQIALAALLFTAFSCAAAQAETIYISNELDNTVSVIDGERLVVTGTIRVGRRPRGIALSPGGTRLYVAAGDDNRIDIIDPKRGAVTGALASGPDPELFAVHPDGRLFIANENDNLITVLTPAGRKLSEIPVGVEPEGVGISADGRIALATSETTSMVHVIDAAKMTLIDNFLVDTRPRWVQMAPDGRIWVSSEIRGTLSVFNPKTGTLAARLQFQLPGLTRELIQAVGFAMTRDGKRAWVALGPANRVAEIDVAAMRVSRFYLVGRRVWHVALSPDERRLYAVNGNSSDVSVIDLAQHAVVKTIPVGRQPWGVAVAP